MDWFSFTWTGNVQKIWDLPGPEASFTAKYHCDYWLKNVLSLVVLFRNFTTHLHFALYIVLLYPLQTGDRPRLMLPWLHLQFLRNVVTDVICTVVGLLMCWTIHSCGSKLLEFLVVRVISMLPSMYLWRRLRSVHFDLYYAELDADYSYPTVKTNPLTLAQRRRATKSLDGAVWSSGSRSRITSCATYEEIFGTPNWEEGGENVTKSLTTLLTIESEGSDDVEGESCLEIIDDRNLTLAEKTLRVLGLTGAHKKTSTTEIADQQTLDVESRTSIFSVVQESPGPRTVGMQVRRTRCSCCEETKCFKEQESDSEKDDGADNCCDKTQLDEIQHSDDKKRDPEARVTSGYQEDLSRPGSRLRAVVERDDIAWENLKEINFVSVINKALSNGMKPFKLQGDREHERTSIFHQIPESQSELGIIAEREDGTKFVSRPQTSWDFDGVVTSASFGVESGILALNASRDFEKSSQSFDSTVPFRPDHDVSDRSHFESSFQTHSDMFDGTLQLGVDSSVNHDPWDSVRDGPDNGKSEPSRDSEVTLKSQRTMSGEKNLTEASSSRSSRSSRSRETAGEREAKTMQALKAYNEKTLLKYKREMEEFRYPLSKRNRETGSRQDSYAALASRFGNPEEELILNIEKAYARFTRSKPNSSTKEFLEIYSGDVGKKDCNNKLNEDKKGMRKQHSKYSESVGESDATLISCKIIQGSKKGREFGRTVAMGNITVEHNVQQVYFLDRQINDRPSTSKNQPITTIKSFPGQLNGANVLGTVSSQVLTPMVEVLNNTEIARIEDTEYYRQLRKNAFPRDVEDAVRNIDWSFRRPTHVGVRSPTVCNTAADVVNPRHEIVEKRTEKMLEIAFANSENSERGFRLGESEGEFYPIFDTFSVAMEEIARAAGRRGYTDEFTSQPATEVDVYGIACRESATRCVSTEDVRASRNKKLPQKEETTSTATGSPGKKPEAPAVRREDSLDRDETVSIHANEEGTSVLEKFIASEVSEAAEINVPEDVLESSEVQSPKFRSSELQGMIAKVFDRFDPSGEILFPNGSLRGSDFMAGLQIVSNLHEIRNRAGEMMSAGEEVASKDTGSSNFEENSQSESRSTSGTTGATNLENSSANTATGNCFGRGKGDRDDEENNFTRRSKIGEPKKLLSSISNADSVSPSHSEVLRRDDFRREVITSAFFQAREQGSNSGAKDTLKVQDKSFGANFQEPEDETPELWVTKDEQQTSRNATPDIVLREIEIADHAMKTMKSVFEKFSKEQEKNRADTLKIGSEVSFLTNLTFPVDGEVKKLQNLVQTVANYAMIFGSTSAQSIKPDGRESSAIFQKAVAPALPESRSVLKNPEPQASPRSKDNIDRFSSWDKIIPLSTRRQLAKTRRKSRTKKPVADREPTRRVVKVAKTIAKKELDFFSARSIPQRGRGLSSGYLMDSDSDGNFTVSRPSTPDSIESTTSLNSSITNEEPNAESLVLQAPNRPIELGRNSSSQGIKGDNQSPRDDNLEAIGTMSVDAAGIENNLRDVEQLILNHQFRGRGPSTITIQTVSKNTSSTTIPDPTRTDQADVEQNCEIKAEENESKSSDALPFDVVRGKSRGSLKDVGIGSKCDTEVLDSKENEIVPDKCLVTSLDSSSNLESHEHEAKQEVQVPNRFTMTSSYDSFISSFSQNDLVDLTDQSRQVTSISNHSRFEEFPEQLVSSLQSLGTICSVVDAASKESSKTDSRIQEGDLEEHSEKDSSLTDSVTSRADARPERDPRSRKTGIPRLIRDPKDQR